MNLIFPSSHIASSAIGVNSLHPKDAVHCSNQLLLVEVVPINIGIKIVRTPQGRIHVSYSLHFYPSKRRFEAKRGR